MEAMDLLITYVPRDAVDSVLAAIGDAGAGRLGNYSHCSFVSEGTGRFTPLAGARPAIGRVGTPESVAESRIEAIYPRRRRDAIIAALIAAHPYETPAFMTLPVNTEQEINAKA